MQDSTEYSTTELGKEIVVNPLSAICLSVSLSVYLSIYDSTALFVLGRFISFLISYAVGRTPWKGDQLLALASKYSKEHATAELGMKIDITLFQS
jgi:hypothetical protein